MTLLQNKFLKYYIGYNDFFDEIEKVSSIQNKSNLAFDIVKYDDHNYEIHVALAGIEPNQIKINTVNDYLVLDVKNKPLSIDKDIIHKGIQNNSTKQVFRLEQNILVEEAELTNGILKIKLYKKDMHVSPRKIIEIIEE
jgi:molecular chaperone IbpA